MSSASQLFTDRRRTTSAALADDITKIRVYYWQRGFREAQVDTVLVPGARGSAVAFRITEGEPTRISTMTVSQRAPVLSPKELSDLTLLHQGEPLSLIALDSTLAHLHTAVWNKGYGDVRIDTSVPRPDASHLVPVRIDIDPRWITRVGSGTESLAPTQKIAVLNKSDTSIAAEIPANLSNGLYAVWVDNNGVLSPPVFINQARINQFEFPEVDPGRRFRLFGRNLKLDGFTPSVRFVDEFGNRLAGSIVGGDAYAYKVKAPSGVVPGRTYTIHFKNGANKG